MKLLSDSESFVIPNLPLEINMTGNQIPDFFKLHAEPEFTKFFKGAIESEERSHGVIVNRFYELEPVYAEHYRKVFGRKSWHIGQVSLCNMAAAKAERELEASVDEHQCLKWLDSKKPNSVVYICFRSITNFADCQLLEFAVGLKASGQKFIWVVKKEQKDIEVWLPEGFVDGKGLIIRD